jgi:hypothetical protein
MDPIQFHFLSLKKFESPMKRTGVGPKLEKGPDFASPAMKRSVVQKAGGHRISDARSCQIEHQPVTAIGGGPTAALVSQCGCYILVGRGRMFTIAQSGEYFRAGEPLTGISMGTNRDD